MKTLKKLFLLTAAVFAFGMIVSCSHEPESSSSNSGVIATYYEEQYQIQFVEFYGDNTWVISSGVGYLNNNNKKVMAIQPSMKGTYSGNPNAI